MISTPKSLRLQIGIFGRTNVGKSSFLNMIAGQDIAITSPVPGTTTDVVEKSMELLPVGPVVFLDTAGFDDTTILAEKRLIKTKKIFDRADICILLLDANVWTSFEDEIINLAKNKKITVILVVNKIDIAKPDEQFLLKLKAITNCILQCSSLDIDNRDNYINLLKQFILDISPEDFFNPPTLIGDLINPGGIAILIVPIDLEAPKGRIILPQVQTIRDILDNDAISIIVKEREYKAVLDNLKVKPDIVICDSQVVLKMVADTPKDIKCSTFSILFTRLKGDIIEAAQGARIINKLKSGDKILIAEACSHHALEDDIGRVKIPRWLKQYLGENIFIDVYSGRDYPENLAEYKLVIHCGACMLTRREMLARVYQVKQAGVPVTNYGIVISLIQGVIDRVLEPFPAALDAFKTNIK